MNILLVNPPRSPENAILAHASDEAKKFIHKKLIGPPLGLLTVAVAVSDYNVTVLDTKGEYDLYPDRETLPELISRTVKESDADVVGVTVITSEFDDAMTIFRTVKKCNPDILTVAGGPHAMFCPDNFFDPSIDIVCTGMAAHTFRKIVEAREKELSFDHIGGIFINKGFALVLTAASVPSCDAAGKDFLMPDRSHLTPWLSSYRVGNATGLSTYLFTSLGCPYKCTFCSIWPQFGGKYYQRSVENIIEELKTLDTYPVVRFSDANTIVNVNFINTLIDRIAAEGIVKDYVMDIRADTAVRYPSLVEKLARHGLKVVICGFESFREEELRRYQKGSNATVIQEAIRIFHENGIILRGNYVIPPDYDLDDFAALADYASSHRVTYAGYTILTPMPGTVLYTQMKDRIIDYDLRKYNFFNCVTRTRLPLGRFYEEVSKLWLIKKGKDVM